MTPKQKQCLDFIAAYQRTHQISPTFDEIKEHVKFKSKSGVSRIIDILERDGFISREPHGVRSISVLDDPWVTVAKAAQRLIESMKTEDINDDGEGVVVVDAVAFGELDVAIKEAEAAHG